MAKKTKRSLKRRQAKPTTSDLINPNRSVVLQGTVSPHSKMTLAQAMQHARVNTNLGKSYMAERIYSQLMEQCPDEYAPFIGLFACLRNRSENNAAQLQAFRMAALFPNSAKVASTIALHYKEQGNTDEALKIIDNAFKSCPEEEVYGLFHTLADIHLAGGDTALALEYYQKALEVKNDHLLSLYQLAIVDAEGSGNWVMDKLLEISRDNPPKEKLEIGMLHFALAYLYQRKDKQKYFHHLSLGNQAVAEDSTSYQTHINSLFNTAKRLYSKEVFESNRQSAGTEIEPSPIFIIAPPRSGTTLLEQILGAHPDTHGVGESFAVLAAVNRVSRDLQTSGISEDGLFQKILGATHLIRKQFFEHSKIAGAKGLRVVDKSIENFSFVGFIALAWPNARIIRLKRHPLDTILSCYHQFFNSGQNYLFDLQALANYYVAFQRFMDFWQELLPDNIMTLEYEDLVSNQEAETRRVLEFCDLSWSDRCLNFQEHIGSVHTASKLQVRKAIYKTSVEKWRPFLDDLKPATDILERELNFKF